MSTAIRPGQTVWHNDEEGVWFSKDVADALYKMLEMATQANPETAEYGNEHCAICKAEHMLVPIYATDEDGEDTDEVVGWWDEDFDHKAYCPVERAKQYLAFFPESPHYHSSFQRTLPGILDLEEMTTQ